MILHIAFFVVSVVCLVSSLKKIRAAKEERERAQAEYDRERELEAQKANAAEEQETAENKEQ